MSLSFQTPAGSLQEISVRLAGSSATAIATGPLFVPWFAVGENNGGTPNLTVVLTDGTTTVYLIGEGAAWNAKAMTAKQGILFDDGYVVPAGWSIKVTSSDASGHMDITGVKFPASS